MYVCIIIIASYNYILVHVFIYILMRIASNLKLTVVKCDSETEEGNSVSNMFTNDTMGAGGIHTVIHTHIYIYTVLLIVPFKTVKEKKVVNVIVKGDNDDAWLHVLRLHMKVSTFAWSLCIYTCNYCYPYFG